MSTNQNHLEFDADSLRNKYREEREKRLRKDGNKQYQKVSGKFALRGKTLRSQCPQSSTNSLSAAYLFKL